MFYKRWIYVDGLYIWKLWGIICFGNKENFNPCFILYNEIRVKLCLWLSY